MTKTFTPQLNLTANQTKSKQKPDFLNFAEPSDAVIQTILNYGKNLEIRSSKLVKEVEYVKS